VDLTFSDPRRLSDVAPGLRDVVSGHGLCRITGEFAETVEYRTQLREDVEGAMGSLQEFEALLCSEQSLDKPVQLLSAGERYGQGVPSSPGCGRQGRDQVDAAVMPFLCCQRFAFNSPLFAPPLKPRQFHANAGDVRAEEPWSLTSLQEKLIKIGQG